ncbi:MAG: electron transfer flavoprotein subunit beta/FixA family protein [Nitrososphaeria archaeon]|jgi:electron transfer flavoprotein beta subunit
MPYNIAVLIKAVYEDVKINPETLEPSTAGIKFKMDDISRNAVEEAVRIKEKHGGKATGIMFGRDDQVLVMREALAMGLDEGILIKGYSYSDPELTARILYEKVKTGYDVILLGYSSADSYTAQIPPRLAALMGVPLIGNAVQLSFEGRKVIAVKSLDERSVKVESELPAVISVAQEINTPRIPPLIQIMAASRKPLKMESANVPAETYYRVIEHKAPPSSRKKIVFEDVNKGVEEILKILKQKG